MDTEVTWRTIWQAVTFILVTLAIASLVGSIFPFGQVFVFLFAGLIAYLNARFSPFTTPQQEVAN
ncbi:MAG: hypothetical protein AABY18_09655 [Candidatus Thermoplasmatota archaeon]